MIWIRTDEPRFFSDLGDVLRLFYGDVAVSLTEGEHILRFTVTGDWMDIDYIEVVEPGSTGPGTDAIRQLLPAVRGNASAPRLVKTGNTLFVEKNGMRFDLTGHRLK